MNASLTRTLLLALAVAATGATVAALMSGSPAPSGSIGAVTPPTASTAIPLDDSVVTLPLVQVVPDVEPTMLATVTVRAPATDSDDERIDFVASLDYSAAPAGGGTGMPYYSFGKSMHRAYRE